MLNKMTLPSMADVDLQNKRVIIRVDLNVPLEAGKITNDARIRAILPTLQKAISKQARILLLSHLGRPKEGEYNEAYSLKPVAKQLSLLLKMPVRFADHWLDGIEIKPGEIVLAENVRFNKGEKANEASLAKKMAALCDVFIMDAFGTAHRAEASTAGISQYAPIAVAGPLLIKELTTLQQVMQSPKRPLVAIIGGAKVSDKLQLLKSLIEKVDVLIVGGGIANTFIAAAGYPVGSSLYEPDLIPIAKELFNFAKSRAVQLVLPSDVVVAKEILATASSHITELSTVQKDEKILDIGPNSAEQYVEIVKNAATILWNGPLGVFEIEAFSKGTEALANAIAASQAFSVAGGGETLAAIEKYKVSDKISYISTGGGAFLEYLEGKTLPAVAALENSTIGKERIKK